MISIKTSFIYLAVVFSMSLILPTLALNRIITNVDKTLRFNNDHEFTILQLSDLHYGSSDRVNILNDIITHKLLDIVKPDMVVITGDAISGYSWDKKTAGFYKFNWRLFTTPFVEKKILYAYILGNHDSEADYNYKQIAELDRTNPYSLFNGDPSIDPDSISNYTIEVLSAFENKKNVPAALLWSFDSKDTGCMGIKDSWGCITANQLDWFANTSNMYNVKYNQKVNGLAFFHIPTPEFLYMWLLGKTYGYKGESIGCPKYNTEVIRKFREQGNIKGVFVGHDHDNDFGGYFLGIELVQCRKTGYGSYGPSETRGGRVIKLKEFLNNEGNVEFSYSHYTITEDGEMYYPETPTWQGYKYPSFICSY